MGRKRTVAWVGALALIVACMALPAVNAGGLTSNDRSRPQAGVERRFLRPDSIVVRARTSLDLAGIETMAVSLGYRVLERVEEPPSLLIESPEGTSLASAVTDFTAKPGVLYAEPAYPFAAADVPPDPLFATQQTYLNAMRAPEAWDITTGAPGIIVGVLDTGIDLGHPDLQGRIWRNASDPPNGADDDGNGCVDDVNGCAFLYTPSPGCSAASGGNVVDDVGHGTFVAGIIAANGDGVGMVGVARNATVLPVKILDCEGNGNTFSLAQGILYAAERGARVLNVSLGGPVDSAYVLEAIRIARSRYGALVVAATGNTGGDVSYPAAYAEVLAVGATDEAGTGRAGFSNSGPEVDVVAHGVGIVGTVPGGRCGGSLRCLEGFPAHAVANGTSFAAPQVSGLAALVLSRNPFLAPDAAAQIMKSTADPMPASDRPGWAGAGRINMLRALALPFRLGAPGSTRN